MKKNVYIVLVGNKAQNGKDTLADLIKEQYQNTKIFHWADRLKQEVTNEDRKYPLVKSVCTHEGETSYLLLNKVDEVNGKQFAKYDLFSKDDVPELHKIMTSRELINYCGMNEKDAPMLQFWGTDYRRSLYDSNYWVNLTREDYLKAIEEYNGDEVLIIVLPDTRFKNEYFEATDKDNAIFIKVTRLNEDGTRYISKDRDPNHISETDLDDINGDMEVTAYTGEIDVLRDSAAEIIQLAHEDTVSVKAA